MTARAASSSPRATDRSEGADLYAERHGFRPLARALSRLRDQRRVELLGAFAPGADLEEQHRVGSTSSVRQTVTAHLAGAFRYVTRLPVHRRRGVLHEYPRLAAGE